MKTIKIVLNALAFGIFGLSSLTMADSLKENNSVNSQPVVATTSTTQRTTTTSSTPSLSLKPWKNRYIVKFEPTKLTGDIVQIADDINKKGYVQLMLNSIASQIRLPKNIPVTFKDCGYANAQWYPETKEIVFCYELIDIYSKGYDKLDEEGKVIFSGATKEEIVGGTTLFILSHELAHGLINIFNLPTTGREEDAVDQFAALLLAGVDSPDAKFEERLARFPLYAAYFFKYVAEEPAKYVRNDFSDVHALGQQRYYDIMCLVLGSDEDFYINLLEPGMMKAQSEYQSQLTGEENGKLINTLLEKYDNENILPYARALSCQNEFKKYDYSWEYLIKKFAQRRTIK